MKLLSPTDSLRIVEPIRRSLESGGQVDLLTPLFSLHAFGELREELESQRRVRAIVPLDGDGLRLHGGPRERFWRNQLRTRWLAGRLAVWLREKVELRRFAGQVAQGVIGIRGPEGVARLAFAGSIGFDAEGLGLVPGISLRLLQASESETEAETLLQWFEGQWGLLEPHSPADERLLAELESLSSHCPAAPVFAKVLAEIFGSHDGALDEEAVVRSATGIRDTMVWKKLFRFQRDGVVGALDKLERYGGCILADSVGLGKTFEALAIIKYHELRNDRVLVLVPKRLRDNWSLYKSNDRRNVLAADRFNYDILNHTDLSRDGGVSGDIELAHVNWGNYDLVVIDESHNFRNKKTPRAGSETRYDRLMRRIIREGVKTRVLMLSATPVNNRLADIRNQIAFATEGDDGALAEHGIASIESATRKAQTQFNRWLELPEDARTPPRLIEMLGFDYFSLLDLLTIARSRKHIERYYGTAETGKFPERLKPINVKSDVDRAGEFRSIREINAEIRRLTLAAYTPLRYVMPQKLEAYERKYGTEVKGGDGYFRQLDREESLIHLLRVNVLKRMESAVSSFALTIGRQLADVEATLARIEAHTGEPEEVEVVELDIEAVDLDDPAIEALLVGRKVRVLLRDVDLVRWRQDLAEDRERLSRLLEAAENVGAARDAKLEALRAMIEAKVSRPINPGNRKVAVFTAFADTAEYLYGEVAAWAKATLGVESALVTGAGRNQTTISGLRRDLGTILGAFAPRSKERPPELASEGDIDLLIATDCISEGQNLQDCDWLVNYDIHWNPVRIIQRFGRIDRIGSPNACIQLVNFWPNIELEEYIKLEQRVSGRMVLLDVSATGEENLIEQQSGNPMNDLEYRRKQLVKLQEAVIDLEDLSTGVSIADLTLTDLRIDLAEFAKEHPGMLERQPLGAHAVMTAAGLDVPPGILYCVRAEESAGKLAVGERYPLAPHYLVHVGEDGAIVLPHTQARAILERWKQLSVGRNEPDAAAWARFDAATGGGEEMSHATRLLSAAIAAITGKSEERAIASLFSPGGTHALEGEFAGVNDFEVIAFLVILPEDSAA